MSMPKITIIFISILYFIGPLKADTSYLLIDPTARYNGIAGAATAFINDPSAMFYNPAGLSNINSFGLTINYTEWFWTSKIYYLAVAKRFSTYGTVGISAYMFDLGTQVKTDQYGTDAGNYHNHQNYYSIGYGLPLSQNVSIGLSSKIHYLRTAIYDEVVTGTSFSTDIGLQITDILTQSTLNLQFENMPFSAFPGRNYPSGFCFGFVIKNLGPDIHYSSATDVNDDELPGTINIGTSYTFMKTNLISILFAYNYERRIKKYFNHYSDWNMFGCEVNILSILSIQKGKSIYNLGGLNQDERSMTGISIGPSTFQLSYSYLDYGGKDKLKYFGLSFMF